MSSPAEAGDGHRESMKQHSRGAIRVRVMRRVTPEKAEGAGNAGCTPHPLPYVQTKETHAGQHRYAEITPALPAQWFYGCSALSSEYRAC